VNDRSKMYGTVATASAAGIGNGSRARRPRAHAATGRARSPATETSLNATLYGRNRTTLRNTISRLGTTM
jgi:hypothetical protein